MTRRTLVLLGVVHVLLFAAGVALGAVVEHVFGCPDSGTAS